MTVSNASWKRDEDLVADLKTLIERGGTWTEAVLLIANDGEHDVPSDRSVRRFFHLNKWFPYQDPTAEELTTAAKELLDSYHVTPFAELKHVFGEGPDVRAYAEEHLGIHIPTPADMVLEEGVDTTLPGFTLTFSEVAPGPDADAGETEPEAVADATPQADPNTYVDGLHQRTLRNRIRLAQEKYDNSALRKQVAKELQLLSERRAEVESLAQAAVNPLPLPKRDPIVGITGGKLNVIVVLADNHVGKINDPSLGGGYTYNKDVFVEYLDQIFNEVYQTLRMIGSNGVGSLYVLFDGDNIDGDSMRPGHAFHVDLTVGQQQVWAANAYARFMLGAQQFGFKHTTGVAVGGNHGRPGRKIDDNPYTDNHEYIMYQLLKRSVEQLGSHTTLHVPDTETAYFRIGEQRVVMEHMHRGRGTYGASPIAGVRERFATLRQHGRIGDYELAIAAHLHQHYSQYDGDGRLLVGSGSMDGGDDYVCNTLGKDSSSSQWILVQHPEEGIKHMIPVFLGGKKTGLPLHEVA